MVQVLDSTLREGEQTPGVYFDSHIKLAIADLLDRVGVNFIEAGHPAVNIEIEHAVQQISQKNLSAEVGAHSRSLKKDVDQGLECGVTFLGIFYCVSRERLNGVFNHSFSDAVEKITGVIGYAKERDPNLTIRYTPEDTLRSSFQNVLRVAEAAVHAGADIISVADTTGYAIPGTERSMFTYVKKLEQGLEDRDLFPKIAVHCHNDRGLALANALDGYRAGADIIDVSVLGLGERAGIVDLAQLLTVLKVDFKENKNWKLELLPELYSLVSRYSGAPIPINFPKTGKNAFTHCAGIHTHAAMKDPLHYESLDPGLVGRHRRICLDHMAGRASVRYALEKIGETPEKELISTVLRVVKSIGRKGRTVGLEELEHIVNFCKNQMIQK